MRAARGMRVEKITCKSHMRRIIHNGGEARRIKDGKAPPQTNIPTERREITNRLAEMEVKLLC